MEDMIYGLERRQDILAEGDYQGFRYYIVSYGTHPCAYVAIPETHPLYEMNYSTFETELDCHGGVTFTDRMDWFGDGSWLIGWDYVHCHDYTEYFSGFSGPSFKKWTTLEMIEEAHEVIDQLVNWDKDWKPGEDVFMEVSEDELTEESDVLF